MLRDASPEARQPVLGADQLFGPQAIPVVLAEEANPREPAGPLHPVEKIVLPLLAHWEVLADGEVAREPVDGVLEMGTGGSLAAVVNQRSLEILGALKPLGTGDDQTGDPRAGHARGRDRVAEVVPPAAIPALGLLPVVPGQRQTSGLTGIPTSLAALRPSRAYWVLELSPPCGTSV